MKFNILPFKSKTTPYQIVMPASMSLTGKRQPLYFRTKKEAEEMQRELRRKGKAALVPVDEIRAEDQIKRDADHWAYLAREYNLTSDEITAALKRHVEISALKPGTVREVLETFYLHRLAEVKAGRLNKQTLVSDRTRLVYLDRAFGRSKMIELTKGMLLELLHDRGDNARSVYKSLSVFIGWSIDTNYLKESPLKGIKPEKLGDYGVNNDFYSVDTFRRMLRISAGLDPVRPGREVTREFIDLLPWFVLSGFAGLRSKEAVRVDRTRDSIQWTDLYFEAEIPHLEVRADVAKKTRRRAGDCRPVDFPFAIEALKAWLPLVSRDERSPYVVKWTKRHLQDLKRAFRRATGIEFEDNGLRNSFGTYAFSYSGESALGQVSKQMGTSETVAKRHYVRNLPAGTGQAWFNLRPFEVLKHDAISGTA